MIQGASVKQRLAFVLMVSMWTSAAVSADEVGRGRDLAQRLCAVCHMNPGQGEKAAASGIPGFAALAGRRGQSPEAIVAWLRSRPESMPDHGVSLDEAWALARFIMSLQRAR
jgi:mono/diheme cytochrome c family protein